VLAAERLAHGSARLAGSHALPVRTWEMGSMTALMTLMRSSFTLALCSYCTCAAAARRCARTPPGLAPRWGEGGGEGGVCMAGHACKDGRVFVMCAADSLRHRPRPLPCCMAEA